MAFFQKNGFIAFIAMHGLFYFPLSYAAVNPDYRSKFINQSNQGPTQYTLVKTRIWPQTGCILSSGPEVLLPGDAAELVIANKKDCDQAGIGYSFYKAEDTKKQQLLGYISHRFRDGQFSLQVSVFCEGGQCIFKELNPKQMQSTN